MFRGPALCGQITALPFRFNLFKVAVEMNYIEFTNKYWLSLNKPCSANNYR